MSDLLASVIKAHGGLERWNAFEKVSTTIVSGSELWATKGIKVDTTPRRVTAAIHREWTSVALYGNPDWRMTIVPERVAIEANAYFNGYAMWTYLDTPFLMAIPCFEVEEIAPWQEEGETWRVLRAKFPAEIAIL